nr:hypothetical protein [uncultured Desulfobacter sp.]
MINTNFFSDSGHSIENPMGLDGHVPVNGIRDFAKRSFNIEKCIFPSLLCIVIYSQMKEKSG